MNLHDHRTLPALAACQLCNPPLPLEGTPMTTAAATPIRPVPTDEQVRAGIRLDVLFDNLGSLGYLEESPDVTSDVLVGWGPDAQQGRVEFDDTDIVVHAMTATSVLLWSARFSESVPVAVILAAAAEALGTA